MSDTPLINYVAIAVYMCRHVIRKWQQNGGYLTYEEKTHVLNCVVHVTRLLSRCILNLSGELSKLSGQFEVPRIQHRCLENKGANADNEGNPGNPL